MENCHRNLYYEQDKLLIVKIKGVRSGGYGGFLRLQFVLFRLFLNLHSKNSTLRKFCSKKALRLVYMDYFHIN